MSEDTNPEARRFGWEKFVPPLLLLVTVLLGWELCVDLLEIPAWLLPATK